LNDPASLGQSELAKHLFGGHPEWTPRQKGEALNAVLRDRIAALGGDARDEKERAAIHAVFLERSGKHEKIASDLGLPYGTFRRYLARGLDRLTSALMTEGAGHPVDSAEQ
jgi:DNA-directed RNA polymerase specialized sigma24 family protein